MSLPDQLWTLTDVAFETDGNTTWIAPLPNGPVIQLQGVAAVLLDHFRDPSRLNDAVDACIRLFDDAPPDAHTQLLNQVDDFVAFGLLTPTVAPPTTISQ